MLDYACQIWPLDGVVVSCGVISFGHNDLFASRCDVLYPGVYDLY